ncbi:MAG: hypothetical protein AB7F28_00190 [Candidatus Margulisiibacteriota bacterium]
MSNFKVREASKAISPQAELQFQIAEWMRVWNRILQNQPELRSLVKDTPISSASVSFRGLKSKALKHEKKEVKV